jgi:hypothetical protein
MDHRQQFFAMMMPHALAVSQATGLDPRLVIAQSALETGYGQHAPGNNYFGIKGSGQNQNTVEYDSNGQPYSTSASFRQYPDATSSAQDYATFLKTNPRYKDMLSAGDMQGQLAALGKSGYATDPNYANSVGKIAQNIQIDPAVKATAFPPAPIADAGTSTPSPSVPQQTAQSQPPSMWGLLQDPKFQKGFSGLASLLSPPAEDMPQLPTPYIHRPEMYRNQMFAGLLG